MIRTTAVPRSVRTGAAAASVFGMIALAGCSATTTSTASPSAAPADESTPSTASSAPATGSTGAAASGSVYKDGTYSADGSYATPESVETISVTVTLAGDVITQVQVSGNPTKSESKQYQSQFIGGISSEVVGKKIEDIAVSRVAGSSLTSGGFNKAIEEIKTEAKA